MTVCHFHCNVELCVVVLIMVETFECSVTHSILQFGPPA